MLPAGPAAFRARNPGPGSHWRDTFPRLTLRLRHGPRPAPAAARSVADAGAAREPDSRSVSPLPGPPRKSHPPVPDTKTARPPPGSDETRPADRRERRRPQPCLRRSLSHLRLIPLHVRRDRHHQIRFALHWPAILVFFVLGRRHHPNIAVVVPAEFPLRIRTVRRWREEAAVAQRPDEFPVIVAIHRVKFFHRPGDVDGTQIDIVGCVHLAICAPIISHHVELLIAFRMWLAAQD